MANLGQTRFLDAMRHAPGEQIFNMPEPGEPVNPAIQPIALRLGARDTLLVVTRFPLNDDKADKKRVLRGSTGLEPPVLEKARSVFELLHRGAPRLQPHLRPHLRPGRTGRAGSPRSRWTAPRRSPGRSCSHTSTPSGCASAGS